MTTANCENCEEELKDGEEFLCDGCFEAMPMEQWVTNWEKN